MLARHLSRPDLPAPLGPKTVKTLPRGTANPTRRKTSRSPKLFDRSATSSRSSGFVESWGGGFMGQTKNEVIT